jgi:hypothetical protein
LHECGGDEKGKNTCTRLLISPHRATNVSRFSPPPLLRRLDYFILFIDVYL